ncbi:MAG TPA: M13 family metallopeptidase [Candidatus Paceibacterota bacterium]|nr:M13 family metallopeptidase [Candidatus Paceibacterota bacterium]
MKAKKLVGFDLKDIDTVVRPQDDFYHYANGGWLKKNKIPDSESRWGSFIILRVEAEKNLKKIIDSLLKNKNLKKGSAGQLVGDLYRSAIDMKTRNKLGASPLAHLRSRIAQVSNREDLLSLVGYFHKLGIDTPWHLVVDQDSKDSTRYALHIYQGGLGLPDRDYYLKDEAEFVRVRAAYREYVTKVFELLGYKKAEAYKKVETILRLETRLAQASMSKEDSRDAEKIYHKKSLSRLQKEFSSIVWNKYFSTAKLPKVPYVIVAQPKFVEAATHLIENGSIDDWKVYLEWHLVGDAATLLSDSFYKAAFKFSQTLTGAKTMKPLWRRALAAVNGGLGEPLGQMYVAKYFDQAKKRKMDTLVSNLFAVYEERIKALDWMSPATKRKAVAKLRMITRKIGYPRVWKSYKGLVIKPQEYFENIMRLTEFEYRRQIKKLTRKSVDRGEWFMSPQTVNAYCNFNLNEIVFPAAILQPPFFNFAADDAFNYGGIGAVIGHEVTHAFDDQGAKFDGHGNMKTWWLPKDKKQFEQKGKILVEQYNGFSVADGVQVNGQLTLGENIADLGGLVIGYDAYQKHLKTAGREDIAGLTPEQRFFLGFAQVERELDRPESIKTRTLTDPHSPSEFRINGPLAHFEPFYEAYGVTPKDKLYRAPKDRAKIW